MHVSVSVSVFVAVRPRPSPSPCPYPRPRHTFVSSVQGYVSGFTSSLGVEPLLGTEKGYPAVSFVCIRTIPAALCRRASSVAVSVSVPVSDLCLPMYVSVTLLGTVTDFS